MNDKRKPEPRQHKSVCQSPEVCGDGWYCAACDMVNRQRHDDWMDAQREARRLEFLAANGF